MKSRELKEGITAGLPVFAGYFPIAVTFGLMAASMNINMRETLAFSIFVFAGASQFVGLNMISSGIGAGEIVLTVFLLNFRHFLMSASVSSKAAFKKPLIPVIAFGITDETFAIASMRQGNLTESYMLGLNFTSYAGWVIGTLTGFIAGDFLPAVLQESISICLYSMFVAILIPAVKKTIPTPIRNPS